MNDESLRKSYDQSLREQDGAKAASGVDLDRIGDVVRGDGPESERLRTIDTLMSSAEGRRELELAWAAARAAQEPAVPARYSPSRRWYALAASLVAVAVTSVWLASRPNTVDGEVFRGNDSPVRLVSPVQEPVAPRAARFVWRRVDKARNYTLVVVDTTGTEIYAATTSDSAITLPDSIQLVPGEAYLWWVQASMSDGSTLTAVTERLTVRDTK